LAEVEVKVDDFGHVKVGDAVDVRVSTIDPSVYGKLQGKVSDALLRLMRLQGFLT
jgi:hypothetical protein